MMVGNIWSHQVSTMGPCVPSRTETAWNHSPGCLSWIQIRKFVVKRSNFFSQVLPDQATKWANLMCKTNDIIGITRIDQARDWFCATWLIRSVVSKKTKVMCGLIDEKEEYSFTRSDVLPSRTELDESHVQALIQQFELLDIFCRSVKKAREKSMECHNHKPQPFPDPKRKRKPTNPNKHKSNKRTKST